VWPLQFFRTFSLFLQLHKHVHNCIFMDRRYLDFYFGRFALSFSLRISFSFYANFCTCVGVYSSVCECVCVQARIKERGRERKRKRKERKRKKADILIAIHEFQFPCVCILVYFVLHVCECVCVCVCLCASVRVSPWCVQCGIMKTTTKACQAITVSKKFNAQQTLQTFSKYTNFNVK